MLIILHAHPVKSPAKPASAPAAEVNAERKREREALREKRHAICVECDRYLVMEEKCALMQNQDCLRRALVNARSKCPLVPPKW
jgi:hypothetical protein